MKEFLNCLRRKGIKIAVNSNKRGDYTSALVNKYFSQFPWTAVYGERESEGIPKKPDPSAALEIADLMKLQKKKFYILEIQKQICRQGRMQVWIPSVFHGDFEEEKNWKKIMHPMWLIIRKIS